MLLGRKIAALILAVVLLPFETVMSVRAEYDEFDTLRQRWAEMLVGTKEYNPNDPIVAEKILDITSAANDWWSSMEKGEDRTYLWKDQRTSGASSKVGLTFNRIHEMALAYKTRGSKLYGNQELLADIISALEWMHVNWYNTSIKPYDNWFYWQVTSPTAISNTLCILYDEVPSKLKDNLLATILRYTPDPTKNLSIADTPLNTTAANRVYIATNVIKHGILVKDESRVASGRDALYVVLDYVTSGNGFYTDGSFIQHEKGAEVGMYGLDLLKDLTDVYYMLTGSDYEIASANKNNIYNWVYDTFEPLVFKGMLMDMVNGRSISNNIFDGYTKGSTLIGVLSLLAYTGDEETRERIGSMVKRWISENTHVNVLNTLSIFKLEKALELIESSEMSENPKGVKIFPSMDRVTLNRGSWALGISMYSTRTISYEAINSQNLKGWYTNSGTTYLYNSDLAQFTGHYWPTIDPNRLPGTTTLYKSSLIQSSMGNAFAGGVTTDDGNYGAVGMIFEPSTYDYQMSANKSYFLFDDEVVAMGNVTSTSPDYPAQTTVENRKLTKGNVMTINGDLAAETAGEEELIRRAQWAHLSSDIPGGDLGYYFPSGEALNVRRNVRTGRWQDINTNSAYNNTPDNLAVRENTFMEMWLDHGKYADNAPYEYVLLPEKSAAEVEAYANNPNISVIAHNDKVHAVAENSLGIVAANFWTNQTVSAGDISADRQGSFIMQQTGNELHVSFADPTRSSETVTIEINKNALDVISKDSNVTVISTSPTIKAKVNLKGKRGLPSNFVIDLGEQEIITPSTPDLDKTQLSNLLESAEKCVAEAEENIGLETGMYHPDLMAEFNVLISAARTTLDNSAATYIQIKIAAENLKEILARFVPNPPAPEPPPQILPPKTATIPVSDDSYVLYGAANNNYGDKAIVQVKNNATTVTTRYGYMKFDLSDVDFEDANAKLKIYADIGEGIGQSSPLSVYACSDDDWTEMGLKYSNRPPKGTLLDTQTISGENWYEFDISSAISNELKGDKTITLVFYQESPGLLVNIVSKEGAANHMPEIALTEDVEYPFLKIPVIADSHVIPGNLNTNYGTASELVVKNDGSSSAASKTKRYGYMKFDLSDIDFEVDNAKLRIYGRVMDSGGTNHPLTVYLCSDDNWSETELTFANRPIEDAEIVTRNVGDDGWYEFDISPAVLAELEGDKMITLMLFQKTTGVTTYIDSKENSENRAPELIVNKKIKEPDESDKTYVELYKTQSGYEIKTHLAVGTVKKYNVFLAVYDDAKRLSEVFAFEIQGDTENDITKYFPINKSFGKGYYMKAMLWEEESHEPMCGAADYTIME